MMKVKEGQVWQWGVELMQKTVSTLLPIKDGFQKAEFAEGGVMTVGPDGLPFFRKQWVCVFCPHEEAA